MLTLSNEYLNIEVSHDGAELCSIRTKDGREYLWNADPAFWKRHSPVLFPVVGMLWDGKTLFDGKEYCMGQHGFARDLPFELISKSDDCVWYRLLPSDYSKERYPYDFVLEIGYRLYNKSIDVMWRVSNPSSDRIYFQIGAHPAFYYAGEPEGDIQGYLKLRGSESYDYVLIGGKGCVNVETHYKLDGDTIVIDSNTFNQDAFIFEDSQVKEVILLTPQKEGVLSLAFEAPLVGLWSPPGKSAPFVCIEPWYGRADRMNYSGEFSNRDHMNYLDPNMVFDVKYTINIL